MSNLNLESLFQDAIRRDDAVRVESLLSECPELLGDNEGSTSPHKLFLFAYEHGCIHVAEEFAKRWPQIATIRNDEDSYTPMHLVCSRGDLKMVDLFGKLNPDSCLAGDKSSKIPLHIAAEKGDSEVIQALVRLCPKSLENVTPNQETALHLAAKNSESSAFQVLVDEIKRTNRRYLLNSKDDKGNTVLHIATVTKSIQILKLLARECFNDEDSLFSSRNNVGQTALDMCPAISEDEADKKIKKILERAAALHQELGFPSAKMTSETRNILLMVLGIIAAAAFTATCNLPASFLKDVAGDNISAEDVVSGRLPTVFYLMVFNSAGFMTSMAAMVILIWPLVFRMLLLFVVICTTIVYTLLVDRITPKFSVSVGLSSISSIKLLWSLALAFISSGVSILCIGRYSFLCFCRFINWLWLRRTHTDQRNNPGRFGGMIQLG